MLKNIFFISILLFVIQNNIFADCDLSTIEAICKTLSESLDKGSESDNQYMRSLKKRAETAKIYFSQIQEYYETCYNGLDQNGKDSTNILIAHCYSDFMKDSRIGDNIAFNSNFNTAYNDAADVGKRLSWKFRDWVNKQPELKAVVYAKKG